MKKTLYLTILAFVWSFMCSAQPMRRFAVLALAENGGHHIAYSTAAKQWLNQLAADSGFTVDYIDQSKYIGKTLLGKYHLFIQLDYPPYGWPDSSAAALQHYIENGEGGWLGFHHASLLGEFDGYPAWNWFVDFMGGIRWKNYIASFVSGEITVEDSTHPVMKGVPRQFRIEREEFYTYDKSPRPHVQVIASVNESTYQPPSDIRMGDHPVIWSNKNIKARNLYIFMGHGPELFNNHSYTMLFKNALFWCAGR